MLAQDQVTAKITIPFATFVLGLALTVGAIVVLVWLRGWQIALDEVLKVFATGVGVTTALYAALNLARLNNAHLETVELKKLELTVKFIERWQDPKTAEACLPIATFIRDNRALSTDEMAKNIDGNNPLAASAMFVLNTLEALAVELKYGALQPQMAHAYFRGVVTTYHSSLSGLVALNRSRKANPRLLIELELLAKSWSSM